MGERDLKCTLCPRACRAERTPDNGMGICGVGTDPVVARAALHFFEEPCISGTQGSGAVFFAGCPLGCVFCQNGEISGGGKGRRISVSRLSEIFSELIACGAHNINLVTPTHFVPAIAAAIGDGLSVPVVYNTGGYELPETLRLLDGKVSVYLPDMKYSDAALAAKYSRAPDYVERAKAAILEMYRQTGKAEFEGGMMTRGVLIRHLVLPGCIENTMGVIDWVRETFPDNDVGFSLMAQYTPVQGLERYPELTRRLSQEEYDAALHYLKVSGLGLGYVQELSSADGEYVPAFDLTGV